MRDPAQGLEALYGVTPTIPIENDYRDPGFHARPNVPQETIVFSAATPARTRPELRHKNLES